MDHPREDIEQAQLELQQSIGAVVEWDESCEAAAGEFVRRLLDVGIEQLEIMRRLCTAGVSRYGATELLGAAINAKLSDEKQAEEAELAGATPVCPHCLAPLGQFDHFCPKCAGPVTAFASVDPMGQIYSAGRAYRLAATDKKPKGVVVLAMWLIFGPSLLSLLWMLSMFVSSWVLISPGYGRIEPADATVQAIGLILISGAFVLCSAILWKVTAHWLQSRCQAADDGQADDGLAGDDGQDDDRQVEARDQ